MPVPDGWARDRHLWKRCAVHVRTRAGVLPGETGLDPVPGAGLLAMELARTMPRFSFLVVGDPVPGAPRNLESAGMSLDEAVVPDEGVALAASAFTWDGLSEARFEALVAFLARELVHTGRLVLLTRLDTPKCPDVPGRVLAAVEAGLFDEAGFERLAVDPLEFLPDGSRLGVMHCRKP